MKYKSMIIFNFVLIVFIVITFVSCTNENIKSNITQLTNDGTQENPYLLPKWSPDGQYISYIRNGDIFIADQEGKRIQHLQGLNASYSSKATAWSVDGNFLAFSIYKVDGMKKTSSIGVINTENWKIFNFFKTRWLSPPVWIYSENGQKVFVFDRSNLQLSSELFPIQQEAKQKLDTELGNRNIVYMTSIGNVYLDENQKIRKDVKVARIGCSISYDKSMFVYKNNYNLTLFYIDKDFKKDIKHSYTDGTYATTPIWSYDNSKIIFCLAKDSHYSVENSDIEIYDLSSNTFTTITKTKDRFEELPSLSPDNKKIVYQERTDGNIYMIKMEDKEL